MLTLRELYFCAFLALVSVVGSIGLMAVVLDIVSAPNPKAVAVYYAKRVAVR